MTGVPLDVMQAGFKMHGRSPAEGFDCLGLVLWLLKHNDGITVPDTWQYATDSDIAAQFAKEQHSGRWLRVDNTEDAHVVLFRRHGIINHIGYVLDKNTFVHILENGQVRVERLDKPLWRARLEGFYKWSE